MAKDYKTGDKVSWEWGQGSASGKVTHVYTQRIEKTIKGSNITRNASKDNPAYLIEQEDGSEVLKSESELSKS